MVKDDWTLRQNLINTGLAEISVGGGLGGTDKLRRIVRSWGPEWA